MDTTFPPLLISSISNFSILEDKLSIVRNSCTYPPLSPWNPCEVWYMDLHQVDWCFYLPSLYNFNCSTRYLWLFYSCNIDPVVFQSFCLCLKVLPCIVVIISLNSVIKSLSDRYTVPEICFKKGHDLTNKIILMLFFLINTSIIKFCPLSLVQYVKKLIWIDHNQPRAWYYKTKNHPFAA